MIDLPTDGNLYNLWKKRAEMPLNFSRVSVSGLNLIPADGPAIITPNHMNWKDIFFIAAMLSRPISFAATIELFDYRLCKAMLDHYFGQYIKSNIARKPMNWMNTRLARWLVARVPRMNTIPVRRSIQDKTFFERAKQRLKAGELLCVFPEGGTAHPGNLRRFKLGVAKLLSDLKKENIHKIPVFPVGIGGTYPMFLPGRRLFFHVRGPVFIDDYSSQIEKQSLREFTDKLQSIVWQLIHKDLKLSSK